MNPSPGRIRTRVRSAWAAGKHALPMLRPFRIDRPGFRLLLLALAICGAHWALVHLRALTALSRVDLRLNRQWEEHDLVEFSGAGRNPFAANMPGPEDLWAGGRAKTLRLAAPQPEITRQIQYVADPHVDFLPAPNTITAKGIRINSLGMRDRGFAIPKPRGTFRILGLGDSFTFSHTPLQFAFLKVLERLAAERPGAAQCPPVEVMNAGVRGWGTGQQANYLTHYKWRLEPNLVLVSFFIGNDIGDNLNLHKWAIVEGNALWMPQEREAGGKEELAESVRRHSVANRLHLVRLWRKAQLMRFAQDFLHEPPQWTPWQQEEQLLHGGLPCWQRFFREEEQTDRPERMREAWQLTYDFLDQMDQECRAHNVPLALMLIPDQIQVDPRMQQKTAQLADVDLATFDFDLPQRRLLAWGERRQVPVLDTTSALRTA